MEKPNAENVCFILFLFCVLKANISNNLMRYEKPNLTLFEKFQGELVACP